MIIRPLANVPAARFPGFIIGADRDTLTIRHAAGDSRVPVGSLASLAGRDKVIFACLPHRMLLQTGGRTQWQMSLWGGKITGFLHLPSGLKVRPLTTAWSDDIPLLFDTLASVGVQPASLSTMAVNLWRASLPAPRRIREVSPWPTGQLLGRAALYGGRKEATPGTHHNVGHYDMPAAYPHAMRGMPSRLVPIGSVPPEDRQTEGLAIASVAIPPALFGPLPVRTRDRELCFGWTPMADTLVHGVWPLRELRMVEDTGGRVIYHSVSVATGPALFVDWLDVAVPLVRSLPGIAGQLGKTLTARLWGMLALDPSRPRTIVTWDSSGRPHSRLEPSTATAGQQQWRDDAVFVAALTTSRVRERLYREALAAVPDVVHVDTDGIIARACPPGWVEKWGDSRVEILGPQAYRRWCPQCHAVPGGHAGPHYSVAGVPASLVSELWDKIAEHPESLMPSAQDHVISGRDLSDVAAQTSTHPPTQTALTLSGLAAG